MLPTAVAEQQAKLGVSAEESKALRLQRQQARFRDRGGTFVPSNANPLVDILLARTVSGESPSKTKANLHHERQASPRKSNVGTKVGDKTNATAGSSKAIPQESKRKAQPSKKRKSKAADPEVDEPVKPAPKRRGRPPKTRETAPEPDSDVERPPATTVKFKSKSKSTSNCKAKGTDNGERKDPAPSTTTLKSKAKAKANPKAKQIRPEKVIEVLVSDDDRTLVEAPQKLTYSAKADGKGKSRKREQEDQSDEDAPIVRRAKPSSKTSSSKSSKAKQSQNLGKKRLDDIEEEEEEVKRSEPIPTPFPRATRDDKGKGKARVGVAEEIHAEAEGSRTKKPAATSGKKRRPADDDNNEVDTVVVPPAKRGKPNSNAAQLQQVEPVPRATETTKGNGKARADIVEDGEDMRPPDKPTKTSGKKRQVQVIDDIEHEEVERPPASKTKKRKKGDDNNDDRPRKTVRLTDAVSYHPSSTKLKENDPPRIPTSKQKPDISEAPRLKQSQTEKPPSRTKAMKGPPRDVLERIKASAAQRRRLTDSEPDELDCLS